MGDTALTTSSKSLFASAVAMLLFAALLGFVGGNPAGAQQANTCFGLVVTVDIALGQVPTDGDDVIGGTSGDDFIAAGDGNDLICGEGGNDRIWGQGGDDLILGGTGDDQLRGGDGNDWLSGESGSDDLNGGRDNDTVLAGDDDDLNVRGGTGDDYVSGGSGNDAKVAGNGGQDVVVGGPGDDVVTGGPRPDSVWGGTGNDTINGNKGADKIWANDGDDTVRGGPQPDVIHGGMGTDDCNGGSEADTHTSCESLNLLEESDPNGIDESAPPEPSPPIPPMLGEGTNFAAFFGDELPDGPSNVYVSVDFPEAGMSVELPDRFSVSPDGEPLTDGFNVFGGAEGEAPELVVTRLAGEADVLDQRVTTDYGNFAVADSCVSMESDRSVEYLFEGDADGVYFNVPVFDVSTRLGPGVAVVYSDCTDFGEAVVQLAVANAGDALLFTVVANDRADIEAFDRLVGTLVLG